MPIQHLFIFGAIVGLVLILVAVLKPRRDSNPVEAIQKQAATKMSPVVANYLKKGTIATTGHINALTEQVVAVDHLEKVPQRLQEADEITVATHRGNLRQLQDAEAAGVSLLEHQTRQRTEHETDLRLLEAQGLKDIEWAFLERETNLKLRSAMILAIKDHWEMKGLTEMYELVVRTRHQIETGSDPEPVKRRLLERYDKNLRILDGAIDDKANRLLKEVDWQESGRVEPDSEFGRDD